MWGAFHVLAQLSAPALQDGLYTYPWPLGLGQRLGDPHGAYVRNQDEVNDLFSWARYKGHELASNSIELRLREAHETSALMFQERSPASIWTVLKSPM